MYFNIFRTQLTNTKYYTFSLWWLRVLVHKDNDRMSKHTCCGSYMNHNSSAQQECKSEAVVINHFLSASHLWQAVKDPVFTKIPTPRLELPHLHGTLISLHIFSSNHGMVLFYTGHINSKWMGKARSNVRKVQSLLLPPQKAKMDSEASRRIVTIYQFSAAY